MFNAERWNDDASLRPSTSRKYTLFEYMSIRVRIDQDQDTIDRSGDVSIRRKVIVIQHTIPCCGLLYVGLLHMWWWLCPEKKVNIMIELTYVRLQQLPGWTLPNQRGSSNPVVVRSLMTVHLSPQSRATDVGLWVDFRAFIAINLWLFNTALRKEYVVQTYMHY